MKPKPFSPLNHFTEPVAIENPLLSWPDLTLVSGAMAGGSCEPEGFPKHCWWCPRQRTIARPSSRRCDFQWSPEEVTHCSHARSCLTWGSSFLPNERGIHDHSHEPVSAGQLRPCARGTDGDRIGSDRHHSRTTVWTLPAQRA